MKVINRFIMLSLVFLLCLTYTNVFAGDKSSIEDKIDTESDFVGTITFNRDGRLKGYPDLYHNLTNQAVHPGVGDYMVYDILFEGNGRRGRGFCVYPELGAYTQNTVNCGKVSPQMFPRSYYAAYYYWDEIKSDRKLMDFVMRMSGIMDKDAGLNDKRLKWCEGKNLKDYPECEEQKDVPEGETRYCDTAKGSTDFRCKRWSWTGLSQAQTDLESAFVISWQHGVSGAALDPARGQEDYVFRGPTTDRGYEILKEVNNHVDEVKENWHVDYNSKDTSGGGSTTKIKEGNFTRITRLDPDGENLKTGTFLIESKTGEDLGDITVTVKNGKLDTIQEWNGTAGIIKVTADEKCKPEIHIKLGKPVNKCPSNKWITKEITNGCTEWIEPCSPKPTSVCDAKNHCTTVTKTVCTPHKYTCPKKICVSADNNNEVELNTDYAFENENYELDSSIPSEYLVDEELINTFNPQEGKPELELYYCSIDGKMQQSYIVVVDGNTDEDIYTDLNIICQPCEVGDCHQVKTPDEINASEIHNCCDGLDSYASQAALDELFCTDTTLKVSGYKKNCNADLYLDKDFESNVYCKQYCGATITYNIPGPTRAKADAYFWFAKNKEGDFTGPTFHEYKRCRTIIEYNKWNSDYESKVSTIIGNYSEYQENKAQQAMWEEMNNHHSYTEVGNQTISCTAYFKEKKCHWDSDAGPCNSWKSLHSCCPSALQSANPNSTCTCPQNDTYCDGHTGGNVCDTNEDTSDPYEEYVDTYKVPEYNVTDPVRRAYLYYKYERQLSMGNNTYNGAKVVGTGLPEDKGTFYEHKVYDDYLTDYNSKHDAAYKAAQSFIDNHGYSTGYDDNGSYVDCGNTTADSLPNLIYVTDKISHYAKLAQQANDKYSSNVGNLHKLQESLNQCGGKYNGYSDVDPSSLYIEQGVKDRVKLNKEPILDFKYYQEYRDSESGELFGQTITVPFSYVDANGNKYTNPSDSNKHCIYEVESSLVDSAPGWVFWNKTGWKDDNYSINDIGTNQTGMRTIKNYDFKDSIPGYSLSFNAYAGNNNNGVYWTSRKYTTDAVGHMTCRWSDDKSNDVYNLIPNGTVIVDTNYDTGNLSDLGPKYVGREGTYVAFKTARAGMFEVYYTMKNIDEPFKSAMNLPGETCSAKSGGQVNTTKLEDQEVNLTCYIEIPDDGIIIQDCTKVPGCPVECCNTNTRVCGIGENCTKECSCVVISNALEYKEVDTANMFPNKESEQYKDNEGYAWNWYKGPNGQEVMKRITDDAKTDKTYSKNNITYSFTLKPSDIRAIRAYNKAMIKSGGYGNFDMDCGPEANKTYAYGEAVKPVSKCKSNFITAISGVKELNYGTGRLLLHTNNMNLDEVRKNWKVFEYDANGKLKNSGA